MSHLKSVGTDEISRQEIITNLQDKDHHNMMLYFSEYHQQPLYIKLQSTLFVLKQCK